MVVTPGVGLADVVVAGSGEAEGSAAAAVSAVMETSSASAASRLTRARGRECAEQDTTAPFVLCKIEQHKTLQ
jgi:hypothetical protein